MIFIIASFVVELFIDHLIFFQLYNYYKVGQIPSGLWNNKRGFVGGLKHSNEH